MIKIMDIMKDISQIAKDLMKYQVEQFTILYKQMLTKIIVWFLIILTAIILAIGGLGLIVWGIYLQLSLVAGRAGSAYILGAFLILIGFIIILLTRNFTKD